MNLWPSGEERPTFLRFCSSPSFQVFLASFFSFSVFEFSFWDGAGRSPFQVRDLELCPRTEILHLVDITAGSYSWHRATRPTDFSFNSSRPYEFECWLLQLASSRWAMGHVSVYIICHFAEPSPWTRANLHVVLDMKLCHTVGPGVLPGLMKVLNYFQEKLFSLNF